VQQRDYILRMIEQLGAALVQLRKMIFGGASAETVRAEMLATARNGGIDLELARLASPDTLVALISVGKELEPTQCWLTAELLYLDGLEAEVAGDAEATRRSFEKALRLFSLLEPAGAFLVGWPEAGERAEEIRLKLAAM
jgi:hypothetical protein